jgi:pSer/pThr/pTyr-binding forkhead associated (FHA) protein
VICDVCGRNNADNLTFCQDCGRRLKAQRVVAPTPPNGIPRVERVEEASVNAVTPAPTRAQRSRPEAPAFQIPPPPEPMRTPDPARVEAPAAAPLASPAAPAAGSSATTCGACGGANPRDYRFCVTCGSVLAVSTDAQAPAQPPAIATKPAPAPPAPAAQLVPVANQTMRIDPPAPVAVPAPIATAAPVAVPSAERVFAARVVEIATQRPEPARLVECPRCKGSVVEGSRFCKFCGGAIEDTSRPARQPAITTPATPFAKGTPSDRSPQGELSKATMASAQPVVLPSEVAAPVIATAAARPIEAPHLAEAPARASSPSAGPLPTRARLVVIVEDGTEGRSYVLDRPQTDVGRTEGDVLLSDDPYVSPRHARVLLDPAAPGRIRVRDLDSVNRVYVRLKKPCPLRDGDLLLLGLEVLQFQTVSDAERGLGHATQHGTLLFGSPAATRRARLCQRTVEGITRDVHHLLRDETVLGRETGDVVFTADPFLSRRHAAIRRNPVTDEFTLTDLDSSNGTFIAIRGETELGHGDFLRIGQHLFRLDLQ